MNCDDAPLPPTREDLVWGWCFTLLMVACMGGSMCLAAAWLPSAFAAAWSGPLPREVVEPAGLLLGGFAGILISTMISRWLQRHRVPVETRRRWNRQFDVFLAQAVPFTRPVMRALHRLLFVRD